MLENEMLVHSERWKGRRRQGITATDIAAIMGLSKYKTPLRVYLEKTEGLEISPSFAMERGTAMEPVIARLYAREYGVALAPWPDEDGLAVCPSNPLFMASPDRIVVGLKTLVEIKDAGEYMADKWGTEGSDVVPDEYFCQAQWQLLCTGYDRCMIALVFHGTDKLRTFTIEPSPRILVKMQEEALRFWNEHVLPGIPPAIDFSLVTREELSALYPRRSDALRPATPEEMALMQEYKRVSDELKAIEEERDELKNKLIAAIAGDEGLVDPAGNKVTYKQNKDSIKVDWEAAAFEAQVPMEIVTKHTASKPGAWVLRPYFPDPNKKSSRRRIA